jgi:hypothetical protein
MQKNVSKEHKRIMLNKLLNKLGYHPIATSTTKTTYLSPFRPQEKTPSFFVFPNYQGKWTNFKDFSSGNGGDIYQFLMIFENIDFLGAKKRVNELLNVEPHQEEISSAPKSHQKLSVLEPHQGAKKNICEVISVQHLKSQSLLAYLQSRKIGMKTITNLIHGGVLQEIHYKRGEYHFSSVAFVNAKGGYATRNQNPHSKVNVGQSDLTHLLQDTGQIKIFEGFMDYLSYLEIAPLAKICDYVILNSTSNYKKALEIIGTRYELVELYLDNDDAGDQLTQIFQKNIKRGKIIDKRKYYLKYNDLNEYLCCR